MERFKRIAPTDRVLRLRDYYINNSPMSVDRDITVWHCHRSLMLYLEGWEKNEDAPTARMRRAESNAHLLRNTRPIIIKGELLTGQPDLTPFDADEQKKYDEYMNKNKMILTKQGRYDHFAMDYTLLLDKGIEGMLEILDEKIASLDIRCGDNIETYEYYTCCKTELLGLKEMCIAYANEAYTMAQEADGEDGKELLELYELLSRVPINPARTFKEALQSIHMYTWSLYGIYSFGKPDTYLLPYYKNDIANGILTEEDAQELVDCFFLLSVPNMSAWAAEGLMLGGRDKDGRLVENEVTVLFVRAVEHTKIPDPNVGFCVTDETTPEMLELVSDVILKGPNQLTVWNSDAVTRSMLKNGFDSEAANMFTLSTCVEVTPIGSSGISITSPYINLLKILLDSLDECDSSFSFEEIFAVFKKRFGKYCNEVILQENLWQLERGRNCTDPIRASLLVNDCLERGKSHDNGGARYNHLEPNILGMQNVGESLNCIYRLVFEEGKLDLDTLKTAIKSNYVGFEELRAYIINKIPHFGTGDGIANKIQRGVADMVLSTLGEFTTVRGARVVPGAFSYREHEIKGRETPASPDGRRNGAPLNDGSCPVQGYDNMGPTVSLACTSSWEPSRFLGGTSINVKIGRTVTREKIIALIKGHIKTECVQLQFNILDSDELRRAQKNPEQYGNLLVRVGGYSDFFVKLPESLQNEIISRSDNDL